jgi:hypothetical protein
MKGAVKFILNQKKINRRVKFKNCKHRTLLRNGTLLKGTQLPSY